MQISYNHRDILSCIGAVTELSDLDSREDYSASTCHAIFQALLLQFQRSRNCVTVYTVKSRDKL
jgi:hypothetical protein